MKRLLLTATILAAPFLAPIAAQAQPVQGLYIGGSAGANFMQDERLRTNLYQGPQGKSDVFGVQQHINLSTGYAGVASVGYGLGNGVRLEVEGDYRHNDFNKLEHGPIINGHQDKYGGMGNVLFDMDIGSPYIYPYLGAGAGYEHVVGKSGGSITQNAFAYQGILGVSLPIPPVVGLSATAEYRYLGVSGTGKNVFSGPGGTSVQRVAENNNHSLMLGLRYAFSVTPPPSAAPAAGTAPAAAAVRSYLVFFDWDKSDLTPRARQIIAEAAQATTRVQVTRIDVSGYADRTGTAPYNQALSQRRANAVAAELVRLGVARQSIDIKAFGDRNPLVPTAAGVREPQNRRVEILFH